MLLQGHKSNLTFLMYASCKSVRGEYEFAFSVDITVGAVMIVGDA